MLYSEIVIAGCGNPLFGDDGFGPAVIEEMEKLTLPDNVTIQDGGAGAPHAAGHGSRSLTGLCHEYQNSTPSGH